MRLKFNSHSVASLLLFSALFIYIIIRANTLSFTHDESFSFTFFNGNNGENTANNHLLNTYLMSVFSNWFGNSELSLRLPNVLSFILYFFGGSLILRQIRNKWIQLIGVSILFLNPYVLDFFSLARGYGLSLGFMAMSLYFFLRNYKKYEYQADFFKDYFWSILFASLALFANLSSINYFISLVLLFVIQFVVFSYFKCKKQKVKFILFLLITLIPLYFGVKRLLHLSDLSELYFGTHNLYESIKSFTADSMYSVGYPEIVFQSLIRIVAFSFPIILIIQLFLRNKFSLNSLKINFILLFMLLGMFFEYLLFDAKFPLGRSVLIYVLIFGLVIVYFLSNFLKLLPKTSSKYVSFIFALVIVIPSVFHFNKAINFEFFNTWKYDSKTGKVMEIIDYQSKNSDVKLRIQNNWLFEPSINYYIQTKNINLEKSIRNEENLNADFFYEKTEYIYDTSKLKIVVKFEEINAMLLMQKGKFKP